MRLHGSFDVQRPRDLDTGKQLARRAGHHGTFGADTVLAGWTLGAEVQASGRRFDTVANTNVLGGYTWSTCTPAPALRATTPCWPAWTI